MSKVYTGTLFNDQCRFFLTNATELIEEINEKTTYSSTAIAALGRSTMISGILGLMLKDDAKVSTIIDGNGKCGKILVTVKSNGELKAKIDNPLADAPKISDNKLNVGNIVGKDGFLRVIKDLNLKEPFVSEIPLINGEIGIDYTNYFTISEQIPTAIAVGVLVDRDHSIKNASTFLVQLMPDAKEDTIDKLEEIFNTLSNFSDIMSNSSEEEFLETYFKGNYNILETKHITYKCDCSYDKFLEALRMLPPADIIDLKKDKTIECKCDFCYSTYDIKSEEI